MTERMNEALAFLRQQFDAGVYFSAHPEEKRYRMEHSIRVMHLGLTIAEAECFDAEALAVGCILHDVGYCLTFASDEDAKNHGRSGARIARPLVESFGFSKALTEEILYGIAIHVDDKADFPEEDTAFARSIADCDNIDRFDAYRVFETLQYERYDRMPSDERMAVMKRRISRLRSYLDMPFATPTANHLWQDRLKFQLGFYERLRAQEAASHI